MSDNFIGCKCQRCSQYYTADLMVSDEVWECIKPEGKPVGGGLLCPTCMMERAQKMIPGWTFGFAVKGE
jgi:hypothetical protein